MNIKTNAACAITVATAFLGGCDTWDEGESSQPTVHTTSTTDPQDQEQRSAAKPTSGQANQGTARPAELVWSRMAFPTGDKNTSSLNLEQGVPREIRRGAPFDMELKVTNLTQSTLSSVEVSQALGENVDLQSSQPKAQAHAGAFTWMIGDLGPGETKVIRAKAVAESGESIKSCASATYNTMLCASVPIVSPKLTLTKTGPQTALRCEDITFNFQVANTGTGSIENVRIIDDLPEGLATVDGKRRLELPVGALAAGQSRQVTAKVRAAKTGTFENKATAMAGDSMKVESSLVSTKVSEPVLKVVKVGPEKAMSNSPFNYEITVTNTSNVPARDVVVEDSLPTGTLMVSSSEGGRLADGRVMWTLGTLEPGASKTLTLTVRGEQSGKVRSTVTAKAYCAEAATTNFETVLAGMPAILLEVIDTADPVRIGENETYEIVVTNQGTEVDRNVKVVCMLEPNQQYVSSSGATRAGDTGQTIRFEPVANLAPKAKAVWRVVVRNVQPGDVRFKVTMTSDFLDRPVEETEATQVFE